MTPIRPTFIHDPVIALGCAITALGGSSLSSGVAATFASFSALNFSSNVKEGYSKTLEYYQKSEGTRTFSKEKLEQLNSYVCTICSIFTHTIFLYTGTLAASCILPVSSFSLLGALATATTTLAVTAVFDEIFPQNAPQFELELPV